MLNREKQNGKKLFAGCCLAVVLLLAGNAPAKEREKPAQKQFKNIQVLKGIPASQLEFAMRFFTTSLGVGCDYCHVTSPGAPPQFEKDDKEPKQTARKMMRMVRAINKQNFEGKKEVTCATCHAGTPHPISTPMVLSQPAELPPESKPGDPPPPEPPAAAGILERYVQALGGEMAAQKLSSRVIKGTMTGFDGREAPIEIRQKAPDKYMEITPARGGNRVIALSGETGWLQDQTGKHPLHGYELTVNARHAPYFKDFRLKDKFTEVTVGRKDWGPIVKLGDRETYLLTGKAANGTSERLYFDTQTGLLARRVELFPTPFGMFPEQTDYEDYRDVDGVKLPFLMRRYERNRILTLKVDSIRHDVQLADSDFEMGQATAVNQGQGGAVSR